ncbi:hypothetical protein [Halomonas sp. LC1]|uniref:hypothetical protein n=1 Tax=unclassified Halomonas TaxID=2609666 RepID=UPI0009BCAE32|nr:MULTISPECIES: hypothetical protein [unclassified Halomonas]MDK9689206.1 hypothetical protein [Halomonas sp. LC1]
MSERKKGTRTHPIPVRFSPEERAQIEEIARQRRMETGENVSLSEIIRELIMESAKELLEEVKKEKGKP